MWNMLKKMILSRRLIVIILLLLQIAILTLPFYFLGQYSTTI